MRRRCTWDYMRSVESWWDDCVSDRFFEVFSFAGAVRTVPQLVGAEKMGNLCGLCELERFAVERLRLHMMARNISLNCQCHASVRIMRSFFRYLKYPEILKISTSDLGLVSCFLVISEKPPLTEGSSALAKVR